MSRREIPTDWVQRNPHTDDYLYEPEHTARPTTPMEALMSAAPGEQVQTSQLEMLALRDIIADAVDALPVRHRWVFEQYVIGRVPLRTLGEWMGLGKSYVWIIKEEALQMLRESLSDHPAIIEYLTRNDNDEDE